MLNVEHKFSYEYSYLVGSTPTLTKATLDAMQEARKMATEVMTRAVMMFNLNLQRVPQIEEDGRLRSSDTRATSPPSVLVCVLAKKAS